MTKNEDLRAQLHALGRKTEYRQDYAPEVLEAFDNKHPERDYWVNHGAFHEDCVNLILDDLIKLMDPKYIEVTGLFTPRGGISIYPYANYGRPGTKYERLAEERLFHHDEGK